MAILSPVRLAMPKLEGVVLKHQGKVRDTYWLLNGFLLIVATDAISIFDFVLNYTVRDKGWVLNVMAHYFLKILEGLGYKTHLVAAGRDIDNYLPEHLRNNSWLQCRAMVVRPLKMYPIEFVHRTHFVKASSSFKDYDFEKGGTICGHALKRGLQDGDELPYPMDTPTTKSETGDMPVNYSKVRKEYPKAAEMSFDAFIYTSKLLRKVGILKFDDKCELGEDDLGFVCFGDEYGTPDCSRFVLLKAWEEMQKLPLHQAPPSADKQIVRNKGIELGFKALKAKNPEDHPIAHSKVFPEETFEETRTAFFNISHQAMGRSVEDYSEHVLGIKFDAQP